MKIALFQVDLVWENKAENIKKFTDLLGQVEKGTDVVFLPEMFTTGFTMQASKFAENKDDDTLNWMLNQAKDRQLALTGSIIYQTGNKYFNRLFFVTPTGEIHYYDKRHLFRMGQEDNYYHAGKENVLINYNNMAFKPQICYDLRFPVWSRNTENYDVLYFVANWPARRVAHWRALLKARAIENQCFVIGVNRVGLDGNGVAHNGASAVYDFNGNCLIEVMDKEEILYAELDKVTLQDYKNSFPAWKDADNFTVL